MNQISGLEWGYASDFYLPLLGPVPFAVYRMLYDDESANNGNASTHDKLFRKAQVSSGEFYHALECLEALALVKTYVNDEGGLHYFVYALYAPKQPKSFFKDVLLVGTLKKYIGEDAVKKLREKYKAPKVLPVFKDVSTTFSAVYHPDFNDPVYGTNPSDSDVVGGELAINTDFNLPAFLANLANYGIKGESLNSDEKASIAKYGILYSITPKAMAEIIANRYDGNAKYGERVDFKKVESDCLDTMEFKYLRGEREDSQVSGDSALAAKIRMMDKSSPIRFLSYLQGNTKPIPSDASIALYLSKDLKLPNGAVNALIDYALQTNDNILNRTFCEKTAAGMLREGVKNARDAMDYLNGLRKKRNGIKKNKQSAKVAYEDTPTNVSEEKPVEREEEAEEDFDTLMAKFYNQK
ncbi:MAG: DnaD domain protein [Candidatus Enteromonas sp.]